MYVNQPLNPKKKSRKWLIIPIIVVTLAVVVAISYAAYVFISYSRIEDNVPVAPEGTAKNTEVKLGTEYTAVTYNIGFGAYTPEFSFFMDGGKSSWAESAESVKACVDGAASVLKEHEADFALLQEVDYDSTRSYHIDESEQIKAQFPDYSSTFAINFHSAFLMYPIMQPHGASYSGLLTMSDSQITSALRRSLPIATDIKKFIDLDRCYCVNRIPVENGMDLVIFNTHMSAYGTDGGLLDQQLNMIFDDMKAEYDKGNYVVCGGDWNHDLTGTSKEALNEKLPEDVDELSWASDLPADLIPEGFSRVTDYKSGETIPSCRNADIPYSKDCFVITVDGFIVSDNVEPTFVDVIDTGFEYSDHNPVELRFTLK